MTACFLDNYSLKNVLLWGSFKGHFRNAFRGSWDHRVVHIIWATFEILPIIGQVTSLFEWAMASLKEKSQAEPFLRIAFQFSTIKEYANNINNTIPWYDCKWGIKFVDHLEERAHCDYDQRIIRISNHLSDASKLSVLVFELCNAYQEKRYHILHTKACWGMLSEEEFTMEVEHLEYDSAALHHSVMKLAIREDGINSDMDECANLVSEPFEHYWKSIKLSPHSEQYRVWYRSISTVIAINKMLFSFLKPSV